MSQLVLLCAPQVFSSETDIGGEEDICRFANVSVKLVKAVEMRNCLLLWELPERPSFMPTIPPHMLYHLNTFFREGAVPKVNEYSSNPRSKNWRARLNMDDGRSLTATDCWAAALFVKW